jgi:hypothetical protein
MKMLIDNLIFYCNKRFCIKAIGFLFLYFRRKTTVAQKLPDQLIPKLLSYILFVRKLRQRHGYTPEYIGAMDETPIWLDMVADTTLDHIGRKSIPIKSTGHEKARITVVLAAKANGDKLKPMIVFKGVRKEQGLDTVQGIATYLLKLMLSLKVTGNTKLLYWYNNILGSFHFLNTCIIQLDNTIFSRKTYYY